MKIHYNGSIIFATIKDCNYEPHQRCQKQTFDSDNLYFFVLKSVSNRDFGIEHFILFFFLSISRRSGKWYWCNDHIIKIIKFKYCNIYFGEFLYQEIFIWNILEFWRRFKRSYIIWCAELCRFIEIKIVKRFFERNQSRTMDFLIHCLLISGILVLAVKDFHRFFPLHRNNKIDQNIKNFRMETITLYHLYSRDVWLIF